MIKALLRLSLLLILFIETSTIQAQTGEQKQVDELFSAWDTDSTPGVAVAIVKDGAIIYNKGYGISNLEYDIPITPATIFHIASVSKQFTVFAILLLEKQGKLSLDDDIRTYIPEVPDFGETITLKHLASHTSGLRDQWNLLSMAGWRMDDVITNDHILKLVSKQKELNFNPGDEHEYCNTGFTLLAEVVSRVSGLSFAEFTTANIFEPLQMNSTFFNDDNGKIVKNRAYSYASGSNAYKKMVFNSENVGPTGLLTTIEDMSKWVLNFTDTKIGDPTIINKMNTLAVLNNGKTFGGALGQFIGDYKGLKEIQHGGADAGYRSHLSRFPDENIAVIVFSNGADCNTNILAHAVADIYLKDKIKTEAKQEEVAKETPTEAIILNKDIIETYIGNFELAPGFILEITQENGTLQAQATGQPKLLLKPISNTEFTSEVANAVIEFVPSNGNNVKMLKLHQGGHIMEAPRVEVSEKPTVNLAEFSGNFYSEELSTTYYFTVVNDTLIAKHSRLSDFNLTPTNGDMLYGGAWLFGQVEFIRNENNIISGCKISTGRVRNLYFEKVK